MTVVDVLQMLIASALGGLTTFAWSQWALGHRITKLETKFEALPAQFAALERQHTSAVEALRAEVQRLAGRRRWPDDLRSHDVS